MIGERNPEVQSLYEWVKNHFLNTLPLTVLGYLLFVFSAAIMKTNSIEFVANVGKTGIWVLSLGCCYVIGKASHLLINALLSRIMPERKEDSD